MNRTKTAGAPDASRAARAATGPVGTPPGGGRWTWDADAGAWRPVTDPPPDDQPAEPTKE